MDWRIVWTTLGITALLVVGVMVYMVVDAFSTSEKRERYGLKK
jgi:hypothetical protein